VGQERHSEDHTSVTDRQCDCAERTGELIVFTCPLCMAPALRAIRALTNKGVVVRLDKSGSVSGTVSVEESHG